MRCTRCHGSMQHDGDAKGFLGPRGLLSISSWRCLNCRHAVDFIKESDPLHVVSELPARPSSQSRKQKGPFIFGLAFLMLAQATLMGCALPGQQVHDQVVAERTERQKLEKAYTEVQEALTKQAAVSLAERQKLEKSYTDAKEALTKQVAIGHESEGKLARLQLLSLEKEIQKKELSSKLEEAMLEVVRTKAKLRSLETKAEAVSALAEGEIALKSLKTNAADQENDARSSKVEELLKASGLELKKENYSGALYLTTQAKTLIREDQERSKDREKKAMMAGEVPFALPLPLQAIGQTKVKEGPSLDSKPLFAVQQGTAFTGYSFKGPWVRVRAEDGRSGWVNYKLVDGR